MAKFVVFLHSFRSSEAFGVWGFGDDKICNFFDFLHFEGICGAASTLDPPQSEYPKNINYCDIIF